MLPEVTLSRELERWDVPPEKTGLVLDDFEELKNEFHEDKDFGDVCLDEESRGVFPFGRYSRPCKDSELFVYVAYGCANCGIVLGQPEIKSVEITHNLLQGRSGLDFYCLICDAPIGEYTFEV